MGGRQDLGAMPGRITKHIGRLAAAGFAIGTQPAGEYIEDRETGTIPRRQKVFYDFCGVFNPLCYIPAPSKGRGFALLRKTVKVKRI